MKILFGAVALGMSLSGCATFQEGLPGSAATSHTPYRAIGYAATSIQPGRTAAQKQLMAIRAAKAAAMRELAEKIYGAEVGGQTAIAEGRVYNDVTRMSVDGLVRSARVVSIQPVRSDVYEAVLEVEAEEVALMRRHLSRPMYR